MAGWDTVYAHLLTVLPSLTVPDVFDGQTLDQADLTEFVIVGDDGNGDAGEYEQDYEFDVMLTETGHVNVRFVARDGDTEAIPDLRTTTQTWMDALATHLKADLTLGGLLTQGSTIRIGKVGTDQRQTSDGSLVARTVTVTYITRL